MGTLNVRTDEAMEVALAKLTSDNNRSRSEAVRYALLHTYNVIVQPDRFTSKTVIVAMTSTSAGPAVYRPEIEFDGTRSRILVDQIYTVTPERLGSFKAA